MELSLRQASSTAAETDALLAALLGISLAVLALVFGLMLLYVVRYRAGRQFDRGAVSEKTWTVEIGWTAATLAAFFGLFLWGADLYVRLLQAPANSLRIYVVGKQWMWKVEHEGGQKEIDELHVPADRDVQLVMTSEDVIHDFSVPAFRVKHDVLPGRYEQIWFRPTLPGIFPLYCTQFCGTDHSAMIGRVIVLSGLDYARWLQTVPFSGGLPAEGQTLFQNHGCAGCHQAGIGAVHGTVQAPAMNGLYGSTASLADGRDLQVDDQYLHTAILYPARQLVAGYPPVMPAYAGQLDEAEVIRIIAYIRTLGRQ